MASLSKLKTVPTQESRLLQSLHSSNTISGLTHNFYRYPARMSPELAHEVLLQFSNPNDFILDPFMGGGTSIVEAVAFGRKAVGVDLNPVATFVTAAKTTPLSPTDQNLLRKWLQKLDFSTVEHALELTLEAEPRIKNLPDPVLPIFAHVLDAVQRLPFPRQQSFARCALLSVGQWAIDCKTKLPSESELKAKLLSIVEEMLTSLDEFIAISQSNGTAKNKITQQRTLLLRSIVDVQHDKRLKHIIDKPKLVITSPPYPGVHVLYHRWQVTGRRETPAPYWVIGSQDGHGASYYTLGSRTTFGLQNYFRNIVEGFRSVRAIIHPEALVVQLVAFSDVETQLPAYLAAMEQAGYCEDNPLARERSELWRKVPNRKWYNYLDTASGTGHELLLFHRPQSTN